MKSSEAMTLAVMNAILEIAYREAWKSQEVLQQGLNLWPRDAGLWFRILFTAHITNGSL